MESSTALAGQRKELEPTNIGRHFPDHSLMYVVTRHSARDELSTRD
jgi:hypothetical protein